MPINFEWTSELSVGNNVIDVQHKRLLSQVNKIISSIATGIDKEDVEDAINFFDEYIKDHLAYEEAYMLSNNYPDFLEHKNLHEDFIEKYNLFKGQLKAGVPADILIMDVETYIGNWWLKHIGIEDKKYAIFING